MRLLRASSVISGIKNECENGVRQVQRAEQDVVWHHACAEQHNKNENVQEELAADKMRLREWVGRHNGKQHCADGAGNRDRHGDKERCAELLFPTPVHWPNIDIVFQSPSPKRDFRSMLT